VGAIDAAALGPFKRKRKIFSLLVVIFLVGTISGKSLKLLPPAVLF